MIRQSLYDREGGRANGFRYRGTQVTRTEALSDAVFGISLTLLVVSLDVPQTFVELRSALYGFIPFGLSLALFMLIWYNHYKYFRRFGLQDAAVIWMNSILLFLVMFFVYPLKFLATFLTKLFSGESFMITRPDGSVVPMLELADGTSMMVVYSLGFASIYFVFVVMYWYALRKRDDLQLNELEVFDARSSMSESWIYISIASLSVFFASVMEGEFGQLSGWVYFVTGPAMGIHAMRRGRLRKRLESKNPLTPGG